MNALDARQIGSLVPVPPWEGAVVSVYSRALNLRLPDGVLVGLVAEARQMSPFSILVPELFAVGSPIDTPDGISRVRTVQASSATIRIGSYNVALSSAERWEGKLPEALRNGVSDPRGAAARLVSALEAERARDGLLELVLPTDSPTIFGKRAREVISAIRRMDSGGKVIIRGAAALVGLGIGFTPSGDDFLSGVVLAQELTGAGAGELDAGEIRSALPRTNDGGRALLTGVLQYRYPQYLLRFAGALVGAQTEEMIRIAVRDAASHGETSGTDALTGITWYLGLVTNRLFV